MGEILVGTSSWTDPTLLDSGWYPPDATTPAERLAFYASRFRLVEVDATYYAPPSERNSVLWVERTPADFTFNIKAFSLLTMHPTKVSSLPKIVRPDGSGTLYAKDLAPEAVDEVFEMFRRALMPLHSAGKLGCVLFQFPEWFTPARANRDYIASLRDRLPDYRCAIEFRQAAWMSDPDRTFRWLRELNLPYVAVDMPQGSSASLPPLVAATAEDVSVVRFHGRNTSTWKAKGISAAERFNYLYSEPELREWQPRLFDLAERTKRTHVLFNNCFRDNGVRNAAQLAALLEGHGSGA